MQIERCYLCPIFFNYANNIINQICFFKSTFVKGPFGKEETGVDGKLRKKWKDWSSLLSGTKEMWKDRRRRWGCFPHRPTLSNWSIYGRKTSMRIGLWDRFTICHCSSQFLRLYFTILSLTPPISNITSFLFHLSIIDEKTIFHLTIYENTNGI